MNPEIKNLSVGSLTADRLVSGPLVTRARVRLDLPYERPPASLWGNTRSHWRARSRDTRQLRADVVTVACSVGLHRLCDGRVRYVTAQLVWAPGDRRPRDDDNLAPMQKVACDAIARGPRGDLVGLQLVPDDTREHFRKLEPLILPPPEPPGMWLDLHLQLQPKDAT
jgi:crossover junction endodeoxyribonuclease RusA